MKFQILLIYVTDGSSVPANVIQGIYDGAQQCQFNMATHSVNFSCMEV